MADSGKNGGLSLQDHCFATKLIEDIAQADAFLAPIEAGMSVFVPESSVARYIGRRRRATVQAINSYSNPACTACYNFNAELIPQIKGIPKI